MLLRSSRGKRRSHQTVHGCSLAPQHRHMSVGERLHPGHLLSIASTFPSFQPELDDVLSQFAVDLSQFQPILVSSSQAHTRPSAFEIFTDRTMERRTPIKNGEFKERTSCGRMPRRLSQGQTRDVLVGHAGTGACRPGQSV